LKQPQVIWVGVEEQGDSLSRLWNAVRFAVTQLGYKTEERDFLPHITIGRVKKKMSPENVESETEKFFSPAPILQTIDQFSLYQSRSTPHGPRRYEAIETFRLG